MARALFLIAVILLQFQHFSVVAQPPPKSKPKKGPYPTPPPPPQEPPAASSGYSLADLLDEDAASTVAADSRSIATARSSELLSTTTKWPPLPSAGPWPPMARWKQTQSSSTNTKNNRLRSENADTTTPRAAVVTPPAQPIQPFPYEELVPDNFTTTPVVGPGGGITTPGKISPPPPSLPPSNTSVTDPNTPVLVPTLPVYPSPTAAPSNLLSIFYTNSSTTAFNITSTNTTNTGNGSFSGGGGSSPKKPAPIPPTPPTPISPPLPPVATPPTGVSITMLYAQDGNMYERFGKNIYTDTSSSLVVVDTHAQGTNGRIFVYNYTAEGNVFVLKKEISLRSTAATPFDGLGHAVSIADGILLVSAPSVNVVYAYDLIREPKATPATPVKPGPVPSPSTPAAPRTTQPTFTITPSDVKTNMFGSAISVYGNRTLIGARGDADNGYLSGAAYIFERYSDPKDGVYKWKQTYKLTSSSIIRSIKSVSGTTPAYEEFGSSVSLSAHTAAVGVSVRTSASVYVFRDDLPTDDDTGADAEQQSASVGTSTWGIESILTPDLSTGGVTLKTGSIVYSFGYNLEFTDSLGLVSAYADDGAGLVFVYRRDRVSIDGSVSRNFWRQNTVLVASNSYKSPGDLFGSSLLIKPARDVLALYGGASATGKIASNYADQQVIVIGAPGVTDGGVVTLFMTSAPDALGKSSDKGAIVYLGTVTNTASSSSTAVPATPTPPTPPTPPAGRKPLPDDPTTSDPTDNSIAALALKLGASVAVGTFDLAPTNSAPVTAPASAPVTPVIVPAQSEEFGQSVAIAGNTLLIGADLGSGSVDTAGVVYVYKNVLANRLLYGDTSGQKSGGSSSQTFAERLAGFTSSPAGLFLIILLPAVALTALVVHRVTRHQRILPKYSITGDSNLATTNATSQARILRVPTTEEDGQRQEEAQEAMLHGDAGNKSSHRTPRTGTTAASKWLKNIDFLFPSKRGSHSNKKQHSSNGSTGTGATRKRGSGSFSEMLEDSAHDHLETDVINNPLSVHHVAVLDDGEYDEDGVALSAAHGKQKQPLAMYDEHHQRSSGSSSSSSTSALKSEVLQV